MSVWGYWLIAAFGAFLVLEVISLMTGWWPTLSKTVWNLSYNYRIVPAIFGLVVGGLAIHFWGPSEQPNCPTPASKTSIIMGDRYAV